MITVQDLYDKTNGGLDIILDLFPQARECVGTKKKFAMRNERTPSASLREVKGVWKVTDFGGNDGEESPVNLFMRVNNISRFPDAILMLAERYGIVDSSIRPSNKPVITHRPAKQDEKDGTTVYELNESISPEHLKVLGPIVKAEHAEALHWYSVKWLGYVKNREVMVKEATDTYPIFMRECLVEPAQGDEPEKKFFKIYEPLNYDKAYRFSYTPKGGKPRNYINGLSELKEAYRKFNAEEEAEFFNNPANEGMPYKEKKLKEAFICSGERDSLCLKAEGYHPLWFNSETYKLSEQEYKEIMRYVEVLYNIPDLDETGERKGKELALQYIDIHTVWLPKWLSTFKDGRGRPRKDFRDWVAMRPTQQDFRNILTLARPAKFWEQRIDKNGRISYEIDADFLFYFLMLNGFVALKDETSKDTQFVRVVGHVVRKVTAKDIKDFIMEWAEESFLPREIRNKFINSPRMATSALDALRQVTLDFGNCDSSSQLFNFVNGCFKVTDKDILEYQVKEESKMKYVWERAVIQHQFKKLDDMFSIRKAEECILDENDFEIEVKSTRSKFFSYLINSSRIHWRKELEDNLEGMSPITRQEYREKHKFDIAGEGLTPLEVREQKMCLINKIFVMGYMLHRYKLMSRAWAPFAMDYKIGEDSQCNGRSGKSFFFKALSLVLDSVKLSGRTLKMQDDNFALQNVTEHTDMILVDDMRKGLKVDDFYDMITSDITVNPKHLNSFTIPFEMAPKLAFTTNFVPDEFNPSSEGRLLYMVFSDYYHVRTTENDYNETRSIATDFGGDLYGSAYSEEDWNADFNFFLQCCKFYLQVAPMAVKIQPPMKNIITRHLKAEMSAGFEDWALTYFAEESGRLDRFIVREDAFNDYKAFAGNKFATMQSFTKKLRAFVELCGYIAELNPEELRNSSGRIIRRPEEGGEPREMLYLRSTKNKVAVPLEQTDAANDDPF